MLFTLGGLGFWTLIDVFFIGAPCRWLPRPVRHTASADGFGGSGA
jgi:hypothetical protein